MRGPGTAPWFGGRGALLHRWLEVVLLYSVRQVEWSPAMGGLVIRGRRPDDLEREMGAENHGGERKEANDPDGPRNGKQGTNCPACHALGCPTLLPTRASVAQSGSRTRRLCIPGPDDQAGMEDLNWVVWVQLAAPLKRGRGAGREGAIASVASNSIWKVQVGPMLSAHISETQRGSHSTLNSLRRTWQTPPRSSSQFAESLEDRRSAAAGERG